MDSQSIQKALPVIQVCTETRLLSCLFVFTPGSGIRNRVFPGLRSWIPNPYFQRSNLILCQLAQVFFLLLFKNKIVLHFVKFLAMKKVRQHFIPPSSFVSVVGSGSEIRDPGWIKSGSAIGVNIPDPQHCFIIRLFFPEFLNFALILRDFASTCSRRKQVHKE